MDRLSIENTFPEKQKYQPSIVVVFKIIDKSTISERVYPSKVFGTSFGYNISIERNKNYEDLMKLRILVFILASFLLVSCGRAPQKEMASAEAAVEAARLAGADLYASNVFNIAEAEFNDALTEVEKQKSKLFLARDYENARLKLKTVIRRANLAKQKVPEGKKQMQRETIQHLDKLKKEIEETKKLLSRASINSEDRQSKKIMQNELKNIESSFSEISNRINSGDIYAAWEKVNEGLMKLGSIQSQLSARDFKNYKRIS